jgi:nucleotide-binding universal stress UspA family protein
MTDHAIVVGIDGSEPGRRALRWALAEARLHGAALHVVHGWHTPQIFIPDAYRSEVVEGRGMREAALDLIDRELDAVGADADTGVVIERSAVHHYAARALIEASETAALVVVGRHGEAGFPAEAIAPKAVQVAHHAACPVAVVPDTWSGDGRGIVVGIDGSEQSLAALQWAADEAQKREASLTAVMAWGLLDQHHAQPDAAYDPHYDCHAALADLTTFVERALGRTAGVALQVTNDLPARGLIDTSRDAELLVVGARGLGGFRGLLLGSVSHRCLAHSWCPTIVVR